MLKSKFLLYGDESSPGARRKIMWSVALGVLVLGLSLRFWREWQFVKSEMGHYPQSLVTVDCGVVLTGSAGRVREGFDLLEQGQIGKLIISGVHSQNTLKDLLPLWPYYTKAQEDTVFLEKRSETTYGNAVQSLQFVQALKCRDLLLITSELHMYRAFHTFRPVFPEPMFIYKHSVLTPRGRFSVFDFFLEVVKSLFYRPWAY